MTTNVESTRLSDIWRLAEKLTPLEKLSLSELLTANARKELQTTEQYTTTSQGKQQTVLLSQYAGVGAELWQKINVEQYIQQERDAWQQ